MEVEGNEICFDPANHNHTGVEEESWIEGSHETGELSLQTKVGKMDLVRVESGECIVRNNLSGERSPLQAGCNSLCYEPANCQLVPEATPLTKTKRLAVYCIESNALNIRNYFAVSCKLYLTWG